jgi:hypothetical protein
VYYTEIFFPIIKPGIIGMIITIALLQKRFNHQLDIKNVFLHGLIFEDLCIQQPLGMTYPQHPTHVCKPQRAFYGLEQAPRSGLIDLVPFLKNMASFVFQLTPHCFFFTDLIMAH